ncbi:MAG: SIMPL domain-containing protein [Oscillospiraceae bacterium]|jgi:uncharacterized protein YggE|nr:SIMPL domain-containing protein [Oscillospiraceae bacterium]
METIETKGYAKKEIAADVAVTEICFRTYKKSAAEAIQCVTEQCEKFLSVLEQEGFDLEELHTGGDSVDQDYDDKEREVCAEKKVKIRMKFDMCMQNHILEIAQKYGLDVDIDSKYEVSNENVLHTELLKQAVEDSKQKAEVIAEAMGQKISGIHRVELSNEYGANKYKSFAFTDPMGEFLKKPSLSDKLQAPIKEEEENVDVIWKIE